MSHHEMKPKPYMNPYVAGFGLGLVLLAAFVIAGRGLGASGAISSTISAAVDAVAPSHAQANAYYSGYVGEGLGNPLKDWLVFEVLGILTGGFFSGVLAGRVKGQIDKGPRISNWGRLSFAVLGGMMMGFGAKLARGCTSGQALTGGALLNLGSWAFMLSVFAGGYMVAYFIRRQWQ